MPGRVIDFQLTKLRLRDEIGAEEEAVIRGAVSEVIDYPARHIFITRGEPLTASTLLIEGLMARYKDLSSGQRQITHIHVPGDFADLHSFTLKYLDHSVMMLTPCRVAKVPHERLTRITEQFPHLTRIFWFSTNLDASIHREWEVSLGRRTAIERAAHLFCELRVRLSVIGRADESGFALPLTQADLAECLGLTSVHVNRVLRDLREMGVVEVRGGRVMIRDLARLESIAEFDPLYLYLDRQPR